MVTRYGGLALMVGVVLTVVASLLHPGNALISPVDQTDFPAAIAVMGDYANLTQAVTTVSVVGMLLHIFAFYVLYGAVKEQGGLCGAALRFGIIVSIIEWSILIVTLGMRHMVTHLMQRSELAADGAAFADSALAVQTTQIAVAFGFMLFFPFASILVGWGLASRFPTMNLFKAASYVLVAIGLFGLGVFMLALHAPGRDLGTLFSVANSVLFVGSICLFIIGLGMYQGRSGLSAQESSS